MTVMHLARLLLPSIVLVVWAVLRLSGVPPQPLTVIGLFVLAGALIVAERARGNLR